MVRNTAHVTPLRALGASDVAVADLEEDPAALAVAMAGAGELLHIGSPMHPQSRAIRHHRLKGGVDRLRPALHRPAALTLRAASGTHLSGAS